MQEMDELLKVQDVAARLHVNTRTVLRMVERGELDAVKVARNWRFQPQDIDTYLKKHHTGSILATEEEPVDDEILAGVASKEPQRPLTDLDREKQRIELEKEQLDLDTRRINFILETSQKMIDMSDIDDETKAKFKVELLETLLPRLLEIGKGRTSERDSHKSKQNSPESRSALELEKV
ncbi:MAG TPA: helix-turn-helix domain-containing protein [Ktedonobacteraceae bacterium]